MTQPQPNALVGFTLHQGDCMEVLAGFAAASIDAIVTDPPYGINFMGNAWDAAHIEHAANQPRNLEGLTRLTGSPDGARKLIERSGSAFATKAGEAGSYDFSLRGNWAFQHWCTLWATECLRVLKPGGHMLVFGGTRTYHRLAAGIEDAGFEIRDCVAWMYGSGFPKSLDVSKEIDRKAGIWRGRAGETETANNSMESPNYERAPKGDPVTAEAQQWKGWGTALKPAFEPVVMARKPLGGTVAGNVLEHGTGAINVDGCRIGYEERFNRAAGNDGTSAASVAPTNTTDYQGQCATGRWPSNVLLDEEAAAALDAQSGESVSAASFMPLPIAPGQSYGGTHGNIGSTTLRGHDDYGGASRFFYVSKPSRAERNAGLASFEKANVPNNLSGGTPTRLDGKSVGRAANIHPTVKPIDVMRHLIRLITPPGGTVLDPFTGSGTTGCAATLERTNFIGIERETNYINIAQARIAFWAEHGEQGLDLVRRQDRADKERDERAAAGQLSLEMT